MQSPLDASRAVKEREICDFKYRVEACLSVDGLLCPPVIHLPVPSGPPSPSSSNSLPSPHRLTLQLESEDVRASNRVSAEVIDSSHRENSPAFSVNGAEPESWRWARHVNSPWLSCQGEARHTGEWASGRTVEQIIVLLGRKGVNNISAQELAVWRRRLRAWSRRNRDAGFNGRVFLCLKVGGFVPTPPPFSHYHHYYH